MSLEHPNSTYKKKEVVPKNRHAGEESASIDDIENHTENNTEDRNENSTVKETEQEKVQKLGALDFEAKSIAAEDRREAEILLTRMKDANYDKALGIHEVLSGREQDARTNLDNKTRSGIEDPGSPFAKGYPEALQTWKQANKDLEEHEATVVRPIAEGLAKEKNPIVQQDHEGKEKKWLTTIFSGPLAPLVALLPSSFFRRQSRYKSSHLNNQ